MTEEEEDVLQPTPHVCGECGEATNYMEEVMFLHVVQNYKGGNEEWVQLPVIDDDGELLYEPYFIHYECWENIQEAVEEALEDMRPLRDKWSDMECAFCRSGIRQWEVSGSFTIGEFHVSRRQPNGHSGETFVPSADPELLCSYCLAYINENITEFWENGVYNGANECIECLHSRCWRNGPNTCDCKCHPVTYEQRVAHENPVYNVP